MSPRWQNSELWKSVQEWRMSQEKDINEKAQDEQKEDYRSRIAKLKREGGKRRKLK